MQKEGARALTSASLRWAQGEGLVAGAVCAGEGQAGSGGGALAATGVSGTGARNRPREVCAGQRRLLEWHRARRVLQIGREKTDT